MTQYALLIYGRDVDWSQPEYAEEMKEYDTFGEEDGASFRGGAALHPTSTATTVRVKGARGGDVVTTDGPYAETKEALTGFYLVEAADLDAALAIAAALPGRLGRRRRGATGARVRRLNRLPRRAGPVVTTGDQLAEVVRTEGARVLAVLVRHLGDWSLAEEAVQEAVVAALQTWPRDRACPTSRGPG